MRLAPHALPLLLPCLACVGPGPTPDVPDAGAQDRPRRTVALTVENDLFTGSDNNYTNGFGLTWQSDEYRQYAPDSFQRRWVDFWSFLPHIGDESCQAYASWTVGQEIFTPDDITAAVPPADDQPYAGVLFLDSTLHARTKKVTHAWNLRLGVVGPAAFGGDTQTWFHEQIGDDLPQGWDTQLPNEPILNVDYTVGYEWLTTPLSDSAKLRLVPLAGASMGNYFTGLSTGLYTELGWNLPSSIGLLSMRRGLDPFVDPTAGGPWSLSLYLGAGAFAVGHYLPLDGTVFSSSPSVESEPLVGFFSGGFTWRIRSCTVGYLLTVFTDTFETQRQSTDYGTLSLSWTF